MFIDGIEKTTAMRAPLSGRPRRAMRTQTRLGPLARLGVRAIVSETPAGARRSAANPVAAAVRAGVAARWSSPRS